MNLLLASSFFLAVFALFLADEKRKIFTQALHKTLASEDKTKIRSRLNELGRGSENDYENFRIYQMILITGMLTFTLGLAILGFVSFLVGLAAICLIVPGVILTSERGLSHQVLRRREIIESEFPALVELLTLSIGAGESPSGAVKRIASRAVGLLPAEFQLMTKDVENGKSFTLALDNLSRKVSSPVVRRFADSMAIAISRGTPLVETLTHSVSEARNSERIKLLNIAGKAEISMMIPVVFLILPISILFAMYPSMASLDLFAY
jgi:tight adherence protein C